MKQNMLIIFGVIAILFGFVISIGSAISYLNRACSCPAQTVGQPIIPCCTDLSAIYNIYLGIVLVAIGLILLMVKLFYKK
jgi:hypothetical protein